MNKIVVTIGEKKKELELIDENTIRIGETNHKVNLSKVSNYLYLIKIDEKVYEVTATKQNSDEYDFSIDGRQIKAIARTELQEKANTLLKERAAAAHVDKVKAPMPGLILKLLKNEGDEVKLGDPLIVLEAMKMENEIRSPAEGIIRKVNFKEGDSVEKDADIIIIE